MINKKTGKYGSIIDKISYTGEGVLYKKRKYYYNLSLYP